MVALIGSPVLSGGPFLFVFKTCARRPPSIVLKRMAVARGAWVAGPDRGQFVTVRVVARAPDLLIAWRSCATVAPAGADLLRRKRRKINCRPALN
jgi:hypothetical protein